MQKFVVLFHGFDLACVGNGFSDTVSIGHIHEDQDQVGGVECGRKVGERVHGGFGGVDIVQEQVDVLAEEPRVMIVEVDAHRWIVG